jgi:hypothetical protein
MNFRIVRRLLAVTAISVLAISAGSSASATTTAPKAHLLGGKTVVTTAPGIVEALTSSGITATVTEPGAARVATEPFTAVKATFPITGGAASIDPLAGVVLHQGGIVFTNTSTHQALKISNFAINLANGNLTANVNDTSTRVPVFTVDAAASQVQIKGNYVLLTNVKLNLTPVAAAALNSSLGTELFSDGLRFGSAYSVLKVAQAG